jgi:UDP-glucuronate decarboxylase
VYGDPETHPQNEDYRGSVNPIGPRACYDEGKRCAETLFFDYHRQHKVDIRVARIFNTYGPRMHPNDGRVVSNFIVQALLGEPITIHGDGSQTRSFCYVDDLVEGMLRFMAGDAAGPGPLNLGNPESISIRGLAELILEMTASRSALSFAERPVDDPSRRQPDIGRASRALGWAPKVPLRQGLERTIAYFDDALRRAGKRPAPAPLIARGA